MVRSDKSKIIKNAFISSAGKYGEYVLALVSSAIIARALGKSDYGTYAYIIWMCGWMIALSNIALPTTIIRYVAECRGADRIDQAERLSKKYLTEQSITTVIICLFFVVFTYFFQPEAIKEQPQITALFICIAVFFKARYIYMNSIAKGYERFDLEAISSVVVGVMGVALVAVLAYYQSDVTEFVVAYLLTSFLLMFALWLLFKINKIRLRRGAVDGELLKQATDFKRATVLLGMVGIFGNRTVEMMLLGQFASSEQVAYLTIAAALTKGFVDLLTVGLTSVLMPSMANAIGRSRTDELQKLFLESTRFYLFCGVGIAFSGILLAKPVIAAVYGADFLSGAWVMSWTMGISGMAMSGAAVGAYLSTTNNQRLRVKFAATVITCNIILAVILVPKLGLVGAVISIGVSALIGLILGFQWVVRNLGATIPFGRYFRIILSGVLAILIVYGPVYYYDDLLISFFAFFLYAFLYLILSIRLNCWLQADYALISSFVVKLPARLNQFVSQLVLVVAFLAGKKLPH